MSNIPALGPNPQYTIPKELLGGQSATTVDHGPFYFISPAFPVHRVGQYRDSVPHIYPCVVTACVDWIERLPEEQCPPGIVVKWDVVRDQVGTQSRVGSCLIPAISQAETIDEMYHEIGVRRLTSFEHRKADEIDVALFNSIIYPTPIEPWLFLPAELEARVASEGGLAVRQSIVREGYNKICSSDFLKTAGKERQSLYKAAAEELLTSFISVGQYIAGELNAADTDIRLRLANAGGKPTYDQRDSYMQWLLARKPINEASGAPLKLELPDGFLQSPAASGLSKEDILEILTKVSENAVQQALAVSKVNSGS